MFTSSPDSEKMILAIIDLEPCLVILPYPNCATTAKGRSFSKDCLMLPSLTCCRTYVDRIWVGEGTPT